MLGAKKAAKKHVQGLRGPKLGGIALPVGLNLLCRLVIDRDGVTETHTETSLMQPLFGPCPAMALRKIGGGACAIHTTLTLRRM